MNSSSDASKRLIEIAFPLKQASLDSVHEKMCHSGHPKAIHIWPARRPLAACRAALIATLLPDPGDPEERNKILEKLGGRVVQKAKKKKDTEGRAIEVISEETEGGILHWGRENDPDLDWFRKKIRDAYGDHAPKLLDPFAGGGAIPLEAMRLGCETTAVDINPVAWFILKCTLEYPQKLAGQKLPLPDFAVQDREFMESYLKAQGYNGKQLELQLEKFGFGKSDSVLLPTMESAGVSLEADLAWHVRAWGRWVLKQARRSLAPYYPTYADFEPLVQVAGKVEQRPMRMVPLREDGTPDIDNLNVEFTPEYLANRSNPRWVVKPSVAYLWARTVTCKNCRSCIPLMKTKWLAKKDNKRISLSVKPNQKKSGITFEILHNIPIIGNSIAEKRAYDKKIGGGTMSRSGVECPCCHGIMTMEDLRLEGQSGRISSILTCVVISGLRGKEFRLPTAHEIEAADKTKFELEKLYVDIPFGIPNEPTPSGGGSGAGRAFSVQNYGLMEWNNLFTNRQLLVLGSFVKNIRESILLLRCDGYSSEWIEAILFYLGATLDKVADYNSSLVHWQPTGSKGANTFDMWVLPTKWDFTENNILDSDSGGWLAVLDWVSNPVENHLAIALSKAISSEVLKQSAITITKGSFDLILTDPPYYDAIPYSDLMDFFYVWLKRVLHGVSSEADKIFSSFLSPKWDQEKQDGELIDDESRHNGDGETSKKSYENGMYRVFKMCDKALKSDGRLVIVFAHKEPDAWETLVSGIIQAGFIVNGSWPIQTEMTNRTRSQTSAALSSSVWLVCKKRPPTTRSGWDNKVLEEMRTNISTQLRDFWDVGIRGPDFVWAATGPALEAYSQYPLVKKANQPGEVMTVGEFLQHVRRMVVDFVVGRVLSKESNAEVAGLDNITTYYLLHRHDFGLDDAPAGPCIMYAVSCGLSDKDLADRYDILSRRGGKSQVEIDDEDYPEEGEPKGSGNVFRLKAWYKRKNPRMGYDPTSDRTAEKLPLFPDMQQEIHPSREIPLIDQVHRLMYLWKSGDVSKVEDYLDLRGLRRNPLFHQLLQALIELATNEERSLLESISNHLSAKKGIYESRLFK